MKQKILIIICFLSVTAINAQLTVTAAITSPVTCSQNATITLSGSGGVAPYEYSINNGVTFQSASTYSVPSGMYTIKVRDAIAANAGTTLNVGSVAFPSVTAEILNPPSCMGSSTANIVVTASGGQSPYLYTVTNTTLGLTTQNGLGSFSSLPIGVYAVSVTDALGCVATTPNNLTIVQRLPVSATTTLHPEQDAITVTVSGGVPPYRCTMNNGSAITFSGSTGTFTNLTAGSYNFTIWDNQACFALTPAVTNNPGRLDLNTNSTYVDYNADGFTDVGDIITYTFTVFNPGGFPVNNVTLSGSGGLSIVGTPIATLDSGASNTTAFTATHILTQADINNGSVVFNITANGIYNNYGVSTTRTSTKTLNISIDGIKMVAFLDSNTNGIKDGAEQNFLLGSFNYELNNNGTVHAIYSSSGTHSIYVTDPGYSYDIGFTIDPGYSTRYSVTTPSYNNVSVAVGSGITTYSFPVIALPFHDLSVNVLPYFSQPKPGYAYQNLIILNNNGNQNIVSETVTFTKDSRVTILDTFPVNTVETVTGGFTYTLTNLAPYSARYILVTMQVPPIPEVALGNLLYNSVSVTAPVGDINLLNNFSSIYQSVIGSYDPNDIMESHGEEILHSAFTSNDYLTYTIRFENTGTANAVNIKVRDILDARLNEATVKTIAASHDYTLDRVGNSLNWSFNGIGLPPSVADTTIGKGYVTFQVKPKPGYAVGDIIPNAASIFFDFNPAIVTNTFNTEFVAVLNVAEFEKGGFTVYPNPTHDWVTISLKEGKGKIDSVQVSDVLGKTVQTKNINALVATIDLSSLAKGIYFVKVTSDGQEKVMKIVRQ